MLCSADDAGRPTAPSLQHGGLPKEVGIAAAVLGRGQVPPAHRAPSPPCPQPTVPPQSGCPGPAAILRAQDAPQGPAAIPPGFPAPAKSPAQCINLAGDTALIPLELEIIFIVVTKFLKPFSDIFYEH